MFLLPLRDDVCEDGVLVVLADELEGGGTATDIVGLQQVTWCERLHINTLPIDTADEARKLPARCCKDISWCGAYKQKLFRDRSVMVILAGARKIHSPIQ